MRASMDLVRPTVSLSIYSPLPNTLVCGPWGVHMVVLSSLRDLSPELRGSQFFR